MKTAQTFFTGFGGADIGLRDAGFDVVSGLELDPQIADVANTNLGGHVRVADFLEVNPFDFEKTDLIHFSPPCTNASVANSKAGESDLDRAFAEKICDVINTLQPSFVSLENVSGYRKFRSFEFIVHTLNTHGYFLDYQLLNAADYSVPQTRRRLILRASKSFLYPMPSPGRWIGWYEAIEDLIPTLPESKFAKWQLEQLPEKIDGLFITNSVNTIRDATVRQSHEPVFTITSSAMHRPISTPKAWLSHGRVVAMTVRALARFQSFPDWFVFPEHKGLACKGVGNAVPSRMMEAIAKSFD